MQLKGRKFMQQLTPTQFVVIVYFSAIMIATVLLSLPISLQAGVRLSLIDALFTATSGVSVTGHTVVNTADTFTPFGHLILIMLFHIGGVGIMTLGTFLWMLLGKNINLTYRRLIMIDQNRHNLSGLVQLMRLVAMLTLAIEAIGVVIFGIYFYAAGYYDEWSDAFYYGFFHAISAYTNAGFDLFGNSMFDFAQDYFVQIITMLLIMLGAIGFPILIEVREYLFGGHKHFRFSLFTKITSGMFALLLIFGTVGIWLMERSLYYADMAWHQKLFYSLFNAVTVRSGGLSTMDVSQYDSATQYLLSVYMFIGASPSSVGGGIRTTTFAVVLLALFTYAIGKNEVRIFKRSIKEEDVTRSMVVFTAGIMLFAGCIFVLNMTEEQSFSLISLIFEAASAFGTCGLSMGITSDLSSGGKGIIMLLMFVGRIGVLSLLFVFRRRRQQEKYSYPHEQVIVG